MAGGKETPRQKMIGMMYLVLTALLALNISKEIINAFIKLDTKMQDSKKAFINNSGDTYAKLESLAALPGNKKFVAPYIAHADKIKAETEKMIEYINTCKNELIKAVEGDDWYEIKNGKKVFKSLMDIENKDDYDAATRLFGGEPGTEGYKKGAEIREKLHAYRNWLCTYAAQIQKGKVKYTFDPKPIQNPRKDLSEKSFLEAIDKAVKTCYKDDQSIIKNIFLTLSTPDKIDDHEEEVDWQLGMFDHAPVVAGAALFTAIENDIRNAEAQAMELISMKVGDVPYRFNKIEPLAFAPAAYLNAGDKMDVRIMTAAYDSTEKPLVRLNGQEYANGIIPVEGNTPGVVEMKGEIRLKQRGEFVWKPWRFKYEVGKPSAVVSHTELNVLYAGYPNKIAATASGFPEASVQLSTGGLPVRREGGNYVITPPPSSAGRIFNLTVSADGKTLGTFAYKVRPMPKPLSFFGGLSATDYNVTKSQIMANINVGPRAAYDDSTPIPANFKVTSFVVKISTGNANASYACPEGKLTDQVKNVLKQLQPNSSFYIQDIRASGPAGPVRVLPLAFTVR